MIKHKLIKGTMLLLTVIFGLMTAYVVFNSIASVYCPGSCTETVTAVPVNVKVQDKSDEDFDSYIYTVEYIYVYSGTKYHCRSNFKSEVKGEEAKYNVPAEVKIDPNRPNKYFLRNPENIDFPKIVLFSLLTAACLTGFIERSRRGRIKMSRTAV